MRASAWSNGFVAGARVTAETGQLEHRRVVPVVGSDNREAPLHGVTQEVDGARVRLHRQQSADYVGVHCVWLTPTSGLGRHGLSDRRHGGATHRSPGQTNQGGFLQ
jgi:hypothetical protein